MNKKEKVWRSAGVVLCGAFTVLGLSFTEALVFGDDAANTRRADSSAGADVTGSGPYQSEGLNRAALQDEAVKAAMSRIPRHRFVPKRLEDEAYQDRALAIGHGQTISQPYIVALMTEQAHISPGAKVLEIGTGSGYQAAVLAELGARVFTTEIIPDLAAGAESLLHELGYAEKVTVRAGDGWQGWPDEAPFDAILIAAAVPTLPTQLLPQLAPHGRMVVPLEVHGGKGRDEHLMVVERNGESYTTRDLGGVRFVPLTGAARAITESSAKEFPLTEERLGIGPRKK